MSVVEESVFSSHSILIKKSFILANIYFSLSGFLTCQTYIMATFKCLKHIKFSIHPFIHFLPLIRVRVAVAAV